MNEPTLPAGPSAARQFLRLLLPGLSDDPRAGDVWEQFCRPLILRAADKLGPQVRSRVDPEDVVQECLRTFLRRADRGEFAGVTDLDALRRLLLAITTRRALNLRRFHLRKQRSAGATVSGEAVEWIGLATAPSAEDEVAHAEALADLQQKLVKGLELDRHRQVAELTFAGHSADEIAARLGCSIRTVFRVHERMREVAEEALRRDDPGPSEEPT